MERIMIALVFLLAGCARGPVQPVVPARAQAIGCSPAAIDSELSALRSAPQADTVQLLQAGRQRFPTPRPEAGVEHWISVAYIVRPTGRVDPCSIRVLSYSDRALIDLGAEMLVESTFTSPAQPVLLQQIIRWQVAGL
jgi:hypothetical protein